MKKRRMTGTSRYKKVLSRSLRQRKVWVAKISQWITAEAVKTNTWAAAPKMVLRSQKHQLRPRWPTPEMISITKLSQTRKLYTQAMFLRNPKSKYFLNSSSQKTSKMINFKGMVMTMKRTTQKTRTRLMITKAIKPNYSLKR